MIVLCGVTLALAFFALFHARWWRRKYEHCRNHPPCPWCDVDGETPHKDGCIASKYNAKGQPKEVGVEFREENPIAFDLGTLPVSIPDLSAPAKVLTDEWLKLSHERTAEGKPRYSIEQVERILIERLTYSWLMIDMKTGHYVRADEVPFYRFPIKAQSPEFKPGQWVRHKVMGSLHRISNIPHPKGTPNDEWATECNGMASRLTFNGYKIEPALPRKGEWWKWDAHFGCGGHPPDANGLPSLCDIFFDWEELPDSSLVFRAKIDELEYDPFSPAYPWERMSLCGCLVPVNFGKGNP